MSDKKNFLISDTLSGILKQCDEEGQAQVAKAFHYYVAEYRRLLKAHPDDARSVAYSVQKEVQNNVDKKVESSKHKVSCRKGCAFCCYLSVDITLHEADLLLEMCQSEDISIDWKRVVKQARKADDFNSLDYQDRKCPFLADDDSCKVYRLRPNSCRKLVVVSDPKKCDTLNHNGAQVARLVDVEAEIISSSTNNAVTSGTMAQMLVLAKTKREK